ncbi:hypothetical protein V2G26_017607 [Clonostachys chloroleuca]|uniref:Translation machinery-associated protein 16 n=1 Tax=Clonostachys chloroleuca TaxID=1926264 RepID=A0AA35Q6L3_9HYPO|nr:unnamed protein product [Clonostachys chloroleuca]
MPSTLQKTRKQISKKRNGVMNALHEKSRDSLRLHKASVRDQRLDRLAAARSKNEQPIVKRVNFFQEALRDSKGEVLELTTIQDKIQAFIHQYVEEYDALKKARRPGRPASTREDLLKSKVAALQAEYDQGFSIPDVINAEGAAILSSCEDSSSEAIPWSKVTTVPWIKVTRAGQTRQADFPTKGLN